MAAKVVEKNKQIEAINAEIADINSVMLSSDSEMKAVYSAYSKEVL